MKKFTIKEFEEMFDNAVYEAMDSLDNKMKEVAEKNGKDNKNEFIFSMQNIMAFAELRSKLFDKEKEPNK